MKISSSAWVCSSNTSRRAHLFRAADQREAEKIAHGLLLMRQPQAMHALHRRAQHQGLTEDKREDALVDAGGQLFGPLVAVGGDQRHAEHHVGFVEHGRRLEVVAVEPDRLMHVARREVRGEGIGQTLGGGQLGAEQARTEQPDRHVAVHPGHGDHALIGLPRAEQQLQFLDVLRKVVGTAHTVAAQGVGGELVGARCTAKAQVDAAGI